MSPEILTPVALHPSPLKTKPQLHSLPIDIADSEFLPISVLIDPRAVSASVALPRDQILFCYQALLNTIDSLLAKRYSDFDGHTTSNCCHGMALLAWHLIQMVLDLDLHALRQEYEQSIYYLEQHLCSKTPLPCTGHAPKALVNLTCLYILCLVRECDPEKGGRTVMKNLKTLAPIGVNTCKEISNSTQRFFANWTAVSYSAYLKELDEYTHVSEAPATLWGKYVGSEFIRSDKRGVKYASNLFSTQITLAYLSQSRAKVALVNDIHHPSLGRVIERYTCLFEGDGQGGFNPIVGEELLRLQATAQDEPIIILGGCIYSDKMDKDSLSLKMQPWLDKLSQLILACDIFYPQFFKVTDDSTFNNAPIIPEEETLKKIMDSHSSYGTHAKNPSLYCSTHIHPSSLKQFLEVAYNQNITSLPFFFIPDVLFPN